MINISQYIQIFDHDIEHLKCNVMSVQFSCSVVSNSLRPHESQHARPPNVMSIMYQFFKKIKDQYSKDLQPL